MCKTEDTLSAARAILHELPNLLGDETEAVKEQLTALLEQADAGKDVEIEVLDLLSEHETTRAWMEQALETAENLRGEKGFSPLPGNHKPSAGVVYECTDKACGETDFSPKVLSTPPLCPKCGKPMKLKR